ncbi:MAG: Ldh family oxidoreductase [Acidiferrobacterales bacterium]
MTMRAAAGDTRAVLETFTSDDKIDVGICQAVGVEILQRYGVEADIAATVVDVLIDADKRGVTTHGLTRLPSYVKRIEAGLLDANARPQILKDGETLVLLDGRNGFGAVAGVHATDLAAERAASLGLCWITVKNSNHIGMLAHYSLRLAQHGLVGIMLSNAGPAVAAFGGKRATLGTNPISIAVPADNEPIALDMATTVVARGKIRRASAEGKSIAPGLALDADGKPTTDAAAALKGTLASIGGAKGYGLAVMIDLLSGLVSGGRFLTGVKQATDLTGNAGVSFTVIAADITRISDAEHYSEGLQRFRSVIKQSGDPDTNIYLPGEIENERARQAEREGITVPKDVIESMKALL